MNQQVMQRFKSPIQLKGKRVLYYWFNNWRLVISYRVDLAHLLYWLSYKVIYLDWVYINKHIEVAPKQITPLKVTKGNKSMIKGKLIEMLYIISNHFTNLTTILAVCWLCNRVNSVRLTSTQHRMGLNFTGLILRVLYCY